MKYCHCRNSVYKEPAREKNGKTLDTEERLNSKWQTMVEESPAMRTNLNCLDCVTIYETCFSSTIS